MPLSARACVPALIGLAFALLPNAIRSQDAPAPDIAAGERDFREVGCSECHGTVGHGGGWQGPKLAPDPVPYAYFLKQLRQPRRAMPRYSPDVLSDAEAANIYAWLQSVPAGKTAQETGLLGD